MSENTERTNLSGATPITFPGRGAMFSEILLAWASRKNYHENCGSDVVETVSSRSILGLERGVVVCHEHAILARTAPILLWSYSAVIPDIRAECRGGGVSSIHHDSRDRNGLFQ